MLIFHSNTLQILMNVHLTRATRASTFASIQLATTNVIVTQAMPWQVSAAVQVETIKLYIINI